MAYDPEQEWKAYLARKKLRDIQHDRLKNPTRSEPFDPERDLDPDFVASSLRSEESDEVNEDDPGWFITFPDDQRSQDVWRADGRYDDE